MEFPIAYFEKNLIFTPQKECWAVYEIDGFQYDFKSIDRKKRYFHEMVRFFSAIEKPTRILILPEMYSFEDHFEQLKERASGPFLEEAIHHADLTKEWLENVMGRESSKLRMFICVNITEDESFKEQLSNIKNSITSLFNKQKRAIEEIAGVTGVQIFESEIQSCQKVENLLFNRFKQMISLNRVDEQRIEWLIRRNFWKGISVPPKRYAWQKEMSKEIKPSNDRIRIKNDKRTKDAGIHKNKKVIRPRHAEFMSLSEGNINLDHRRMVKISQLIGKEEMYSYSSYLTVEELPDEFEIPGMEFLYHLNEIDFPVAVSMYIDPISHNEAKAKLKLKKMDIADQSEHTAEAVNGLPINLQESILDAELLEKELDDYKYMMYDTSIVFEVIASNDDQCLERMDYLKNFYKSFHLRLVNPSGEQWQLFNEFLPAGDRLCSKDYVHRISPLVLASSMFAGTKTLGDDEGYFIGTTGVLNQPVFFDPARAPRVNKSASGAFIGSLGGGKSYTANFLIYLPTLFGAKTLIFDPKGDRLNWTKYLQEFKDEIDVVTLSNHLEDAGKLDPWGIYQEDVEKAADIATNIIHFILDIRPSDEEFSYITDAVEYVKLSKARSMMKIIQRLDVMGESEPVAKKLARHLNSYAKSGQAKLLFHDGELNALNLNRRITILNVANLDLPDENAVKSEYSLSEILSISFMFSITAFATKFTEEDKSEYTSVILDEFWALSASKEGRKLATRLIRTGRYFYAAVFIISQNANDLLDERIKNNLGFKFVFRSGDNDEVRNILKFLDLEDTPENIEIIKSIQNGKPLFSDLDGHCGIVDIDVIFPHIDMAFDTTAGKEQEKEVS